MSDGNSEEQVFELKRDDERELDTRQENQADQEPEEQHKGQNPAAVRKPAPQEIDPFPDDLRNSAYLKQQRGSTIVYADSKGEREMFRDEGDRLRTREPNAENIKAMIDTAQHRNWQSITVRGPAEFKREAWLDATARGMNVKGYKPSELDLEELKRREEQHLDKEISGMPAPRTAGQEKDEPGKQAGEAKHDRKNAEKDAEHTSATARKTDAERLNRQLIEAHLTRKLLQRSSGKELDSDTRKAMDEMLDTYERKHGKLPDIVVVDGKDAARRMEVKDGERGPDRPAPREQKRDKDKDMSR